jgi:hypothetical protein|tara:strand:+ start:215 stop:388 length:174 start_codon:yes stop_codon:yes gene_type:complete
MPVELNGTPANKQDQTGNGMHVIFEPQDNREAGDPVIEKHHANQHGQDGGYAKGREN